ncbi:lipoprotein signal peptidase [Reichenbachiella sp. 5M10]|uniref:lipoprotein signal peptidase n=1 Tax=Reichenbachiella sp. 5M10 TaxID=1889772 RepID=UPI000C15A1D2|nr:lipoprotein signal peptidase [Reichenbachiella sp. 5M10]PIB36686.1 lipoprotein signal peptidase [Reichenbachiella sp. 5M10]
MKYYKYFLISLAVIILDQVVKLVVHFNMDMGVNGQIQIFGEYFKLHYLTNPGMAFGMKLGTEYGKLFLTLFRLLAMVGISYYLYTLIQRGVATGLLVCIALILGGAIGNVIDSTFYGVFLDNAPYDAPTPWFYGQVVDMFYIDIWEGRLPDWLPIMGGKYMSLWPVFNVADAAIFVGVAVILIFQKRFFTHSEKESPDSASTATE